MSPLVYFMHSSTKPFPNSDLPNIDGKAKCNACETLERCVSNWLDRALIRHIYPILEFCGPTEAGEAIYRKGDTVESLLIVRSGSVRVLKPLGGNSYDVEGFYFPGDLFSLCALDEKVQEYDVFSLKETVICQLPLKYLESIGSSFPRFQQLLVSELTAMIRRQSQRLYSERHLSAEDRVRLFLKSIFERNLEEIVKNRGRFALPMTKRDIAFFLGMSPESLSRILKELEAQGVINNHFNHIVFRDIKQIMHSTVI